MVAASATTRGVDMGYFLPRTSASIEADAHERGDQHERDIAAVELEAEVDRDPETGERPGVVERVKSAVERIPHPKG
jgi:hypothetical protein